MSKKHLKTGSMPPREQGAVLFVGIVILLLITMIGITAMQGSTMQERMAGNMRDSNVAFQAAESALRDVEGFLFNRTEDGELGAALYGIYENAAPPHLDQMSTWATGTKKGALIGGGTVESARTAKAPEYIAERLPNTKRGVSLAAAIPMDVEVFRAGALGYGGRVTSQVIVQSTSFRLE